MQASKNNDKEVLFENIISTDPRIEEKKTNIILRPFYWNYNFITNFVPLLVSIYIVTQQSDPKVTALCILIIAGSVFLILQELSYYNKIFIDVENKIITIRPNFIWKYKGTKQIFFKDIREIYVKASGFWPSFRRYVIISILNTKKVIFISAGDEDTAQQISRKLSDILK